MAVTSCQSTPVSVQPGRPSCPVSFLIFQGKPWAASWGLLCDLLPKIQLSSEPAKRFQWDLLPPNASWGCVFVYGGMCLKGWVI